MVVPHRGLGEGINPEPQRKKICFSIKRKNGRNKYEPLRSRGEGYPDLSRSTTKKQLYFFCVSSIFIFYRYFDNSQFLQPGPDLSGPITKKNEKIL